MKLHFPNSLRVVVAWIVIGLPVALPAADQRTYTTSGFQLLVDGNALTLARGWSGGERVASVAEGARGPGGIQKKHVANVAITPLQVVVAVSEDPALLALMNEALTNAGTAHTVTLNQLDFNGKVSAVSTFGNARVTGLELPAYSGASKDTAEVVLTFTPVSVSQSRGTGANVARLGVKTKTFLASNFSFAIDGLPGSRIASVAAFAAQSSVVANNLGIEREGAAAPTQLGLSNLILEISMADLPDWQAWADSFLAQGRNTEADEKSGTLTQLAADMRTPGFTVQFSHLGLVRLSQSATAGSNAVPRFTVELYVEGAALANPGAGASQPPSTVTPTPAPATDAPAPTNPADPNPAAVTPAGNPPITTKNPEATVNPPERGLVPAPAGGKAAAFTDPADQGVRDPRDFFRIEGLVRKTYESAEFEASSSERVTYVAAAGIDDVLAKYEAALKGAKWELVRKSDGGSVADFNRTYTQQWTKMVQAVQLSLVQTKSGGTELTIVVEAHRQGVLSGLAAALKDVGPTAVAKEGSPNDQGERDPADFPRINRATRKSYNAYGTAPTLAEEAVYRTKAPIAAVEAFYVQQLGEGEWDQNGRHEYGDPLGGSHVITMDWTRAKRTVKVSLREIEPAITEISISLTASK